MVSDRLWHHGEMAKRPLTLDVDEALLEAARAEARQTGRSEAEVVEDVLRKHFESRRVSTVDEVWARNAGEALTGDDALALAYKELEAMRRERGEAAKAAS